MRFFKMKSSVVVLAFLLLASGIALYSADKIISDGAKSLLYDEAEKIPYHKTGLLLGTGKYLRGNAVNPYYAKRITAAKELFFAGKVKYLVISGDNSRHAYNEPRMMKDDLIKEGIDSNLIFLDYAGFRTFDSMVRLREIFSVDSVTVISQKFHNERALFIAGREGIFAVGFNAEDTGRSFGMRTQIREKFARVKVFVDYLIHTKPKFLGEKVRLPE